MRIILHGISAFEYWRSSLSNLNQGDDDERAAAQGTIYGGRRIGSLKEATKKLRQTDGSSGRLHVLVPDQQSRRNNNLIASHLWDARGGITSGAIVQIGENAEAASPELCLVQMAPFVTRLQLMRAITDLCSRYSVSFEKRMNLVERAPVTTISSISSFLGRASGLLGVGTVKDALRWCVENSRSPRETTMDLYLNLPTRLGGKQLPPFEANRRLDLKGGAALLTRRSYLEGDVVWLEGGLVLEYNSDTHHDSEEQMAFDFEKITALEAMGMTVVPLSTRQFNDYDLLESVVGIVREHLGSGLTKRRERPSRVAERDARCRATHAELLAEERRQRELPALADTARWRFLMTQM